MSEGEKATLFTQMCNALGFSINPKQGEILIAINKMIDEKGSKSTMEDLNEIVDKYLEPK